MSEFFIISFISYDPNKSVTNHKDEWTGEAASRL